VGTLCGGHISPLLRGVSKAGIKLIDFLDERNAAFFAMGLSIVERKPGVAIVTAGPGVTNTFTAVKTAKHAQVPLVVIGGDVPFFLKGRGFLQDTNQLGYLLGGEAVKWARRVSRMRDLPNLLEEAFRVSKEGVPGPVFLEIPMDILYGGEVTEFQRYRRMVEGACGKGLKGKLLKKLYVRPVFKKLWTPPAQAVLESQKVSERIISFPSASAVRDLGNLIKKSGKPVLVMGNQILWSPFLEKMPEVLNFLGLPTYLMGLSRGILGSEHRLFFKYGRKRALGSADLVILAGAQPDFRLGHGQDINKNARLVRIDFDPSYLRKNRKADLEIKADVGQTLLELCAILGNQEGRLKSWFEYLNEGEANRLNRLKRDAQSKTDISSADFGLSQSQIFFKIQERLGRNDIVVVDGGDFAQIAGEIIYPSSPASWIEAGPFGTLGIGIGSAIAAKVARPDAQVWAIFGDGTFAGYNMGDFITAVRHGIHFISIIGNNAAWMETKRKDEEIYGKGESVATDLRHERYDQALAAFGVRSFYVQDERGLAEVLELIKMCSKSIPVAINARIRSSKLRAGSF